MPDLPQRRWLHHTPPSWVKDATFFVTICCQIRGQNQLCHPTASEQLFTALRHYRETQHWYVHLWLLMPDHAHALLSVPSCEDLAKVMAAWKRHTARHAGIEWQKGFFDHRLRSDESFEEKAAYIRQNPVRAGLITNAPDWPHIWTPG
jgi:putative transposase